MIQESLPTRWHMACATILLNQTRRTPVWDRTLYDLFGTFPSPSSLAQAGPELEELLRPHGFQNVKANRLRRFCSEWLEWDGTDLEALCSIGNYAVDSDWIFYFGERPHPDWVWDKELVAFLEREAAECAPVSTRGARAAPPIVHGHQASLK